MSAAHTIDAAGARRWGLRLLAFTALSIGGAALLLHAAGWLTFQFVIAFGGPPAALALIGVMAWARGDDDILLHRMYVGLVSGALGTVAYDVLRAVLLVTGIFRHNLFAVIPIFGSLATGLPVSSPVAVAGGWAYHVWNGVTFAGMYGIAAGRAHWGWGVFFGMALEAAYMGVIPGLTRVSPDTAFVVASIGGHAAYGAVVGLVCQHGIKE